MGRPEKSPHERYVTLYASLPAQWAEEIRRLAAEDHRSIAEIMRRIIERGLPLVQESKSASV